MIEIKCSKIQYERIIDALRCYYEDHKCGIGRSSLSCPAQTNPALHGMRCEECLKKHIRRITNE